MSMKSFKKPALQLRRSHFSKKDLVLDRLDALHIKVSWRLFEVFIHNYCSLISLHILSATQNSLILFELVWACFSDQFSDMFSGFQWFSVSGNMHGLRTMSRSDGSTFLHLPGSWEQPSPLLTARPGSNWIFHISHRIAPSGNMRWYEVIRGARKKD